MYSEANEVVSIKISDVNNENIKKNIEYEIYEKDEDGCKVMLLGDNRLILKKDKISFTIDDFIPFKYHRGVLSLEEETNLYINFANKFFGDMEDIKVKASWKEDDNYINYMIKLISNDTNVTNFINKVLEFESMFKEKLKAIENEIVQMLDKI